MDSRPRLRPEVTTSPCVEKLPNLHPCDTLPFPFLHFIGTFGASPFRDRNGNILQKQLAHIHLSFSDTSSLVHAYSVWKLSTILFCLAS